MRKKPKKTKNEVKKANFNLLTEKQSQIKVFSYVTYMRVRNMHENELISPGTDLISLFTVAQIKEVSNSEYFQKTQNKKVSN